MSLVTRHFGSIGAILGAVAVGAGAFGAHALRGRLDDRLFAVWTTAASYNLVHALALVVTALVLAHRPRRAARVAGHAFLAGIVLFSGSLYALALTDTSWLGAVTPLGGVAFLLGWVALAVALAPGRI